MYIIRSDAGQPLREELAKSPEKILSSAFPDFVPKAEPSVAQGSVETPSLGGDDNTQPQSNPAAPSVIQDAYFQGLALIKTLVKLMPGWLQSNRVVFDTLVLLWKSPTRISRLQNKQEQSLVQVSTIGILEFCCI